MTALKKALDIPYGFPRFFWLQCQLLVNLTVPSEGERNVMTRTLISTVVLMFSVGCATEMVPATETAATVYHRTMEIEGLDIFSSIARLGTRPGQPSCCSTVSLRRRICSGT